MFYLDVWEGIVADWVPYWGGEQLALSPIFNIADASIFAGVAMILVFQRRFFVKVGVESIATEETETGRIEEEVKPEI